MEIEIIAVGGYDEGMPRHQDRELLLRLSRDHSIWLGRDTDVDKHRMTKSLSHEYIGYIAGMDALAVPHTQSQEPLASSNSGSARNRPSSTASPLTNSGSPTACSRGADTGALKVIPTSEGRNNSG